MKSFAAASLAAFALTAGAAAQSGDPKLDFLGYCIGQGNSTNYCACLADTYGAKLNAKEFAVYLDYLQTLARGERDQAKIIAGLKERHGITGKELGRILQLATVEIKAEQTCAGL